ncbi:YggT family protein [Sedimentibacter acidaminivorans]|jgi:YggT family protein|uniref:YggT family protein n=1 Tax=Sedimentibacter acidaminivorans TaxID=913099 RepID=A0ABS4GB30_9FIRM|nr:YggT family protein [Sedimentibacter acidaminivorans]MBP1924887.1 YggT family protein [Sedimentibacter acidaminivorans]
MYVIKYALSVFIRVVNSLILIRVLLSFFPNLRYSKITDIIYQLTEPILAPCRTILSKFGLNTGMVDFSPILAYMILRFVQVLIFYL